jgi:hypothetical protein
MRGFPKGTCGNLKPFVIASPPMAGVAISYLKKKERETYHLKIDCEPERYGVQARNYKKSLRSLQ